MIRALLAAVLIAVVGCAHVAPVEYERALVIPGRFLPFPHAQLAYAWTDDPLQVERGYCGIFGVQRLVSGDSGFVVLAVVPGEVTHATQFGMHLVCTAGTVPIHTHPPATCMESNGVIRCMPGGQDAFECFPSDNDIAHIRTNNYSFGILQCGPDQFTFFQPLPHK